MKTVTSTYSGNTNTTTTSALFGQGTETQSNDPRFIQLAFRFSF